MLLAHFYGAKTALPFPQKLQVKKKRTKKKVFIPRDIMRGKNIFFTQVSIKMYVLRILLPLESSLDLLHLRRSSFKSSIIAVRTRVVF